MHSDIEASRVAVYETLKQTEVQTSQGLVRCISKEAAAIIHELGGSHTPQLAGYRVKIVDENCIEGTDHRDYPKNLIVSSEKPWQPRNFDRQRTIVWLMFERPNYLQ